MGELKRAASTNLLSAAAARAVEEPVVYRVTAPQARYVYPLKRAFSVSELYTGASKAASAHSPSCNPIYHSYYRDWDLGNDYRYYHRYDKPGRSHFSLRWPKYGRYHPSYPESFYPSSYRHHSTSATAGSRYKVDYFDSFYWKCRLDPYEARSFPGRQYAPWSFRPRVYETTDVSGAVKLYRQGLIGFDTFEKYWIKPSGWYNHYMGKL